ncbi:FAD-dependent oxidoreductase [Dyadobacter tibetensis]|uniref:FAD-dependent oxidoreductase n=1 Tax=Dyadobacter tibetensis TaxID=1211851 RepID=UPI0004B5E5A0|nr:FAD-dependent oxidoreductase [Dyadobacter tibetensis]
MNVLFIKKSKVIFLIGLWLSSITTQTVVKGQTAATYDIVVYGATSAGVMAAYTAAKNGKSVLLIDPGTHLGGLTTGGLGYTDIGNKYAITGLARDFYRRIGKHYGRLEQWTFEPHVAKNYLQQYLDEAKVGVVYQMELTDVSKTGSNIRSLRFTGRKPDRKTLDVKARMYIDCTYEGDLMAAAGVSYHVGREANSEYGEDYNGVQLLEGHQLPDGIDPYKEVGKPSSGLLWGIQPGKLEPQGSGDSLVQAYNFRICLTNRPENMIPISKPENYDPQRYELLARLIALQPEKTRLADYFIWSIMPNQKTDINNRNGFSTDMIGMNYAYPEASWEVRERIVKDHEDYTKGLLYFFGNDARVPAVLRAQMRQWGYPKDEYTETGNWSPQLYIREARRMKGMYVMTQANCQGKTIVKDGIGMAAYTMDSHNTQRIVVDGMAKNEGNVEVGGFGPYPIAYRSIIPVKEECDNLLVPVCLSATHIAFGSIRMEPVFMVLAQSAAMAAVMAIDGNRALQDLDVAQLQKQLETNPFSDGRSPEILVDNHDESQVEVVGEWVKKSKGGYGPDFLASESPTKQEAWVGYKPRIEGAGKYAAYLYIPQVHQMLDTLNVTIRAKGKSTQLTIRKADIEVVGQTSGEWYHLGEYDLASGEDFMIKVHAPREGKGGTVMADALLFIPN